MFAHNGKLYARVSDILKPFTDFSGIAQEILDNKAILGTHVHDAIHQQIEGKFLTMTVQEQGYMDSFNKWRSALMPTFVESEVRYYCDEKMLTGAIDALVEFQGEKEAVLVDFKTSAQESPKVWPMQAHLYHYLIASSGKSIGKRFLFLKLDKHGNLPQVFEYKFDANLMNRCLQAVDEFWAEDDL